MLMVVLGHTISGSSINYEHNFIFQVIWTLQMPLFILISGYVTRYSKSINNINELSKYIKKRSLAYMLPWLIWTFLIRGLIFDESKYLNLKYILWNMDSGYWFLATIWTISLLFGLAEYFANKISLSKIPRTIIRVSGCLIWMVLLGLLGFKLGLNFFAIKLTLYYFPFYIIGYIYGQFQDTISTSVVNKYKNIFTGVCLLVWVYLINRIDFYSGNDDIGFIITRFVTSLIGCISVTSLIINWANSLRGGILEMAGIYSLEIYMCHYLSLNVIRPHLLPVFSTLLGLTVILVNYIITLLAVSVIIWICQSNRFLNLLLFYKRIIS